MPSTITLSHFFGSGRRDISMCLSQTTAWEERDWSQYGVGHEWLLQKPNLLMPTVLWHFGRLHDFTFEVLMADYIARCIRLEIVDKWR